MEKSTTAAHGAALRIQQIRMVIDSWQQRQSDVNCSGVEWREKAANLIRALLPVLEFKVARDGLQISPGQIRDALSLANLAKLNLEGEQGLVPVALVAPIKAYLQNGLPRFEQSQSHNADILDREALEHHGYLTALLSDALSQLENHHYWRES
ncbi:hypothetical protein HMPREF3069_05165 [Achromobacter xylosoxidans]|uniref:hypothetical protein n=1 Tax=Alcaligenes xylosoxydans xylosoxydans TaxID=85698 RepID=UPI0008A28076|nr:hypothetical protein [Achromobacter xylosoxidans]OFS61680.1 hypothetical protein HMPREF3069_05165 [Achromobacter xylosoxidans]